jgi:hypothetical protein
MLVSLKQVLFNSKANLVIAFKGAENNLLKSVNALLCSVAKSAIGLKKVLQIFEDGLLETFTLLL